MTLLMNVRPTLYLPLALLLAVIALFFPVGGFAFLSFDDNVNIYNNVLLRQPLGDSLWRFWSASYDGLYIPVTYTFWLLLAKLSAIFPPPASNSNFFFNPAVFHYANLFFHAVNSLIVFCLLRLLLRREWPAAAGALLFAVHPVQVEAVAWATGMKDTLSGFFVFLALWQYILSVEKFALPVRRSVFHYGLAIVFFLAAMLAKPSAVSLPLATGILGYLLLKQTPGQMVQRLLPLFLIALPVMLVTKFAQPGGVKDFVPAFWQRPFIAGDAVLFYLGKLVLPIGLGPDYGRTPDYVLSHGMTYGLALIPYLLVTVLCWKIRNPFLIAATGVFVAFLLPVLGFIPFSFQAISTVADRYLYLALLGPALGIGSLLLRFPGKPSWFGVATVILLLGYQSTVTVTHWNDSMTISAHALEVNSRSWVAHNIVAAAQIERQRFPDAAIAAEKSIAANQEYDKAYLNWGIALQKLMRFEEAISAYQKALALRPSFLPAYMYLAGLYMDLGRLENAKALLQEAENISGQDGGSPQERALRANTLGRMYFALNRFEESIAACEQAVTLSTFFPEAYNNLGNAYLATNRYPEALAAYQEAVRQNPTLAAVHNNLCDLYNRLGSNDEALASCQTAMRLDPMAAGPYLNLGNIMLAFNKTEEAIAAYQKALELAPNFDVAAFNLGLVYQALGNNSAAIFYYRKTLEISPDYAEAQQALSQLGQNSAASPAGQPEGTR